MLDEAERRDPDREGERVMLVDGARHRLDLIQDQCDARGAEVRILIGFVPVREYTRDAAWCFFAMTDPAARAWASQIATEILQGRAEQVTDNLEARGDTAELDSRRRPGADKAVGCLRAELPCLGYGIALAEGRPITKGGIEGRPGRPQPPRGDQQRRLRGVLGVSHTARAPASSCHPPLRRPCTSRVVTALKTRRTQCQSS